MCGRCASPLELVVWYLAMALKRAKSYRDMSVSEQIAYHSTKGASLRHKDSLSRLNLLLESKPEVLTVIENYLESLGIELPSTASKKRKQRSSGSAPDGEHAEEEGEAEQEGEQSEVTPKKKSRMRPRCSIKDPKSENWIPHCYTKLENCKAAFLESMLAEVAPIAFSQWHLKGLKQQCKKNKEDYQTSLTQILEYVTGMDPSAPLVGDRRHIPHLQKVCQEAASRLGHRASQCYLPLQWPTRGVYRLMIDDEEELVQVCLSQHPTRQVDLTPGLKKQLGTGDFMEIKSRVEIACNWSDARACLIDTTTGQYLPPVLSSIVPSADQETSSPASSSRRRGDSSSPRKKGSKS